MKRLIVLALFTVGCESESTFVRWEAPAERAIGCYETGGTMARRAVVETPTAVFTVTDGFLFCWRTVEVRRAEFSFGRYLCTSERSECKPIKREVRK